MRRFVLGTVKKYNHSADGQAPYRGYRRGTTGKAGKRMPHPQKLSRVGVRVGEQQEMRWREFGEAANSPDVAVVGVCICNSIFQAPL